MADAERALDALPATLSARDAEGALPLHRAVQSGGCADDVIALLLRRGPAAAHAAHLGSGRLPLQLLRGGLREATARAVFEASPAGATRHSARGAKAERAARVWGSARHSAGLFCASEASARRAAE